MSTYQVGNNKPIKLKVSISTVAHAITYAYLNDPDNDGSFKIDIPPFSNTDATSWRQINNGDTVKGRTLKVITFLTFFNEIPDENTFNLIIEQSKASYKPQVSGGTPTPFLLEFDVFPSFQNRTAVFSSLVSLT
jgi:hypothetical protein